MDKMLLKKSWILAGLLLVISIILGLIMVAVVEYFKIGSAGMSGISGIIGAMIVGEIYAMNFKKIMPKKLRIDVTAIYVLFQMVLVSLYSFIVDIPNYLFFFSILIGVCLFYSLFIYGMLGSGGKIYLKTLQKRKSTKK